ncbi:hypothetical protein COHA_000210 [Chlorella ohadii]|uniref:Uncharacterized protein n=1 Tax=Chlorella ohadii TaxID=2649997 RepID=A0AAD5DZ55_9CHLO|nr:hypothetical protein COHA_000210 [Chlorella ohadii]
MLLSVRLPPPGLPPEAQQLLLQAGKGLEPTVRVLVYCRQTGAPMLRRDWLLQEERRLYMHPRFRVPTWDSGDGWKLLFPTTTSDIAQAQLFTAVLRLHGGVPSAPLPTPTFAARTAAAGMAQQGTHVRQQQQSGGMTWRLPPQ